MPHVGKHKKARSGHNRAVSGVPTGGRATGPAALPELGTAATPAALLSIQRRAGNRAAVGVLARGMAAVDTIPAPGTHVRVRGRSAAQVGGYIGWGLDTAAGQSTALWGVPIQRQKTVAPQVGGVTIGGVTTGGVTAGLVIDDPEHVGAYPGVITPGTTVGGVTQGGIRSGGLTIGGTTFGGHTVGPTTIGGVGTIGPDGITTGGTTIGGTYTGGAPAGSAAGGGGAAGPVAGGGNGGGAGGTVDGPKGAGGPKSAGPKGAGPTGPGPTGGGGGQTKAQAVAEAAAKKALPKFLANTYTFPNFTKGINGKFDVTYTPTAKLLDINVKVKFDFKGKGWSLLDRFTSATKFINQAQSAWSGQHEIENVRPPTTIWGAALNPVRVRVRVTPVSSNQHFIVRFFKKAGGAQVHKGVTKMFKGDLTPGPAFNPVTGKGELARVKRINPSPVNFGHDSAKVPAADQTKLTFLATNLKRINRPPFTFTIESWTSTVGARWYNQQLATRRAKAVAGHLKAAGLTNHTIKVVPHGEDGAGPGAEWRKTTITPSIPAGWKNKFATAPHEFGHMLGLGDEYQGKKGTVATHHGLVAKHFGKAYADQNVKRGDVASAGVMHFGDEVRVHHYVTLWSALAETTSKAKVPTPPFGYSDWKIRG